MLFLTDQEPCRLFAFKRPLSVTAHFKRADYLTADGIGYCHTMKVRNRQRRSKSCYEVHKYTPGI